MCPAGESDRSWYNLHSVLAVNCQEFCIILFFLAAPPSSVADRVSFPLRNNFDLKHTRHKQETLRSLIVPPATAEKPADTNKN